MSARRKGREGLSFREALFVEAYLACNCNGTEAARRAGYKGDRHTLKVQASRLLTRANLRDALQNIAVDAWETLQRLSDHARASIEDFLDDACTLDLAKARAEGKLPLVKELTQRIIPTKDGDIRQTTVKLQRRPGRAHHSHEASRPPEGGPGEGRAAEDGARARRDAHGGDPAR